MITAAASRNTTVGVTYFSHGQRGLGCGGACSGCAEGVGAGVVTGVGVEAAAMVHLLGRTNKFPGHGTKSRPGIFSSACGGKSHRREHSSRRHPRENNLQVKRIAVKDAIAIASIVSLYEAQSSALKSQRKPQGGRDYSGRLQHPLRSALPPGEGPPQNVRNPNQEVRADLTAVRLVEHFMPTSLVKIVEEIGDAGFVIAINQSANPCESLADGVFTSGEYIHGKILADFGQTG